MIGPLVAKDRHGRRLYLAFAGTRVHAVRATNLRDAKRAAAEHFRGLRGVKVRAARQPDLAWWDEAGGKRIA